MTDKEISRTVRFWMARLNQNRPRIIRALRVDTSISKQEAEDASFHLLDWLSDLYALYHVLNKPEEFTLKQINHVICQSLVHVPEHIAAAAKLVVGAQIRDIFEEGVLGTPVNYSKKRKGIRQRRKQNAVRRNL